VPDDNNQIPKLFQNYSHCFGSLNEAFNADDISHLPSIERYRSISGYGNNVNNPKIGESFTSYGRLLKADYDDHIYAIRKSERGYELPSPRNIVRKLFLNDKEILKKYDERTSLPNVAAIMFSQLITHDTGSRQLNQYVDGGDGKQHNNH
jgi:hypothetical protein